MLLLIGLALFTARQAARHFMAIYVYQCRCQLSYTKSGTVINICIILNAKVFTKSWFKQKK